MARTKKAAKGKVVRKRSAARPISREPGATSLATPELTAPSLPAAAGSAAIAAAVPRITLADVLDQAAAGTLHAELLSRRGFDAQIDAAGVRRIGGQCLQVLLSAAATWTHDGAALAVVNATPEFTAGVRLLGIDPSELESRKPFAGAA
jgi:chemotaxis protein CheX